MKIQRIWIWLKFVRKLSSELLMQKTMLPN